MGEIIICDEYCTYQNKITHIMNLLCLLRPTSQTAGARKEMVCDVTRRNDAAPFLGQSHAMVRSSMAWQGGYGEKRGVGSNFCERWRFRRCRSN